MGVGGHRHAPCTLPSGMIPDIEYTGGWLASRVGLVGCAENSSTRILSPTVKPVASTLTVAVYSDKPIIRPCTLMVLWKVTNSWSRVLFGTPTGCQPCTKFPAFYPSRKFITAVTRSRHLSLLWARSVQSMPLISLLEGPPRSSQWSVLWFPHQNPACAFTLPMRATCSPSHSSWFDHPNVICWVVQTIQLLVMQSVDCT